MSNHQKVVLFHDINPQGGNLTLTLQTLLWNSVKIRWCGRYTPTTTSQKYHPIFWLVRSPTVDKWAKSAVSLSCVRKSVKLHKKPTILVGDATDAPWLSREHSETRDHLRDIRWTFNSTTGQDLPPVEFGSRVCSSLDSSSSWTSS